MHIADGIMAAEICVAADAVSAGALYAFGRKTRPEEVPRMGFVATAIFAASLIHIPLAGTSVHLSLIGLAGILLGLRSFPVIFTALLFQSLIFQHGGLISIGLNTINMGAGALLAWGIWRWRAIPEGLRAFTAGFCGILLPALLMATEFELTGYGRGAFYILAVYAVVAALEGGLTLTIVSFFRTVKPELLMAGEPEIGVPETETGEPGTGNRAGENRRTEQ
jgi:cobalt/nickel transport system permease protein